MEWEEVRVEWAEGWGWGRKMRVEWESGPECS